MAHRKRKPSAVAPDTREAIQSSSDTQEESDAPADSEGLSPFAGLELDFERIETAGKVELGEEHRLGLPAFAEVLSLWYGPARDSYRELLSSSRPHLKKLCNQARSLANTLNPSTVPGRTVLRHIRPRLPYGLQLLRFRHQCEQIARAADGFLAATKPKPGRPQMRTAIRQLHDLYLQAGGKGTSYWYESSGRYTGAFYHFVEEIFRQAGCPVNQGLGKTIQRALQDKTKT